MQEVAEEEKANAVMKNRYHQGVPAITVVVDGGWSKPSHKHSYNAKSGVAVNIGHHTRKLQFLGFQNKFCSVCAIAHNKGSETPEHTCYCNWNGSSVAMESDIIAEGFSLSEKMYGLRYISVIGDGDSSVMATICQSVTYGVFVNKIECANHACKAYRGRLETLAKDHQEFRGKGGLTKRAIQRLTIGARVAITNHSKTGNVNQLCHDLCNGPAHVFGDHSNCNPDFCSHRSIPPSIDDDDEELATETLESDANTTTAQQFVDQLDNILDQLEAHHSKQDEDDTIQGGHSSLFNQLPPGLFNKVMACSDRLVMLAPQLISNQTSNLAECYMSIRYHFVWTSHRHRRTIPSLQS